MSAPRSLTLQDYHITTMVNWGPYLRGAFWPGKGIQRCIGPERPGQGKGFSGVLAYEPGIKRTGVLVKYLSGKVRGKKVL